MAPTFKTLKVMSTAVMYEKFVYTNGVNRKRIYNAMVNKNGQKGQF